MSTSDYWTCDNCHKIYKTGTHPQTTVTVEQRSERIFGTDVVHRPVERLVICTPCLRMLEGTR